MTFFIRTYRVKQQRSLTLWHAPKWKAASCCRCKTFAIELTRMLLIFAADSSGCESSSQITCYEPRIGNSIRIPHLTLCTTEASMAKIEDFIKAQGKEIDPLISELSVMKHLIKEHAHP